LSLRSYRSVAAPGMPPAQVPRSSLVVAAARIGGGDAERPSTSNGNGVLRSGCRGGCLIRELQMRNDLVDDIVMLVIARR
jgi:hypothetical protein